MILLLIGFSLLLTAFSAEAACPSGSYPWVDGWGTKYAKQRIQAEHGPFREVLLAVQQARSHGLIDGEIRFARLFKVDSNTTTPPEAVRREPIHGLIAGEIQLVEDFRPVCPCVPTQGCTRPKAHHVVGIAKQCESRFSSFRRVVTGELA